MSDISKKLLSMKERIDTAKTDIDRLKGRKDQLYEALKKEFKCNTLKEAEEKLKKMSKDLDKKESELEKGVKSLEEKFEWT